MKSVVTYIRNLLGFSDKAPHNQSFKRNRADEDFSSDEDTPALKRPKQLLNTRFPTSMASNGNTNGWDKEDRPKVRYVPIQLEAGHPSTSTPLESTAKLSRVRTVPIQLVAVKDNNSTPTRNPRSYTPIRHAVIQDDDDQEVRPVEAKQEIKKKPKIFVDLDDYEDDLDEVDNDVLFVKEVASPTGNTKPYYVTDSEPPTYYRLARKVNNRRSAPKEIRTSNKFIEPPGITKAYKKHPATQFKWLQSTKPTQNRYQDLNGSSRVTFNEIFNLTEKKNYQELIKRGAALTKPVSFGKPLTIINLADDMLTFKNTQRTQKKALNEINLVQKGLDAEKENSASTEYDPITVASINSSDSEIEIVPSEASTSSSIRIDPINTLKDSYRDKAVTSGDWLPRLDKKYKKKKQETQDKLKNARRENDIISKVNSQQSIALLENKLKFELSISESLFEEPQPTVELPALTPEQEKKINALLGPGPPGQLIVEKFNLRIHRRDLQTLSGLNWLNDEVINFYMNLLMQRSEEKGELPRVYAANTFFYPKLMQGGQAGLRRWTRKVDIFAHDLMIVPVHLGVHWCLSIVDFRAKRVSYLDSMGGRNQACLDALLRYLKDEHQDKKGAPFDATGWKTECLKDIPQQMNGSDCGMFACTFAEFAARGVPFTFTQAHMPYLRRKAALEICLGRLLL